MRFEFGRIAFRSRKCLTILQIAVQNRKTEKRSCGLFQHAGRKKLSREMSEVSAQEAVELNGADAAYYAQLVVGNMEIA